MEPLTELSFADMRAAAVRCWTAACDVVTSLFAGVAAGHVVSRQWLLAICWIAGVAASLVVRRILRHWRFHRFNQAVQERLERSPEDLDAALRGTGGQYLTAEHERQINQFRSQVRGIFLLRYSGLSWMAIILVGAITAACVYESWRRWFPPAGQLPYSPLLTGVIEPPQKGKPPILNAQAAERLTRLLDLEHAGWWLMSENRCFKTRVTRPQLMAAIKTPSDLDEPAKEFLAQAEKRMAGWLDAAAALDASIRAVDFIKHPAVQKVRDQLDPTMKSAHNFSLAITDFSNGPALDKRKDLEDTLAHFSTDIDLLATALRPLLQEIARGDVLDVHLEVLREAPQPPGHILDVACAETVTLLHGHELLDDLRHTALKLGTQ